MRIIIFTGMVIVFISVFFMLFIFDVMVKAEIPCAVKPLSPACRVDANGMALVLGLVMIAVFFLIDVLTVWLILKTLEISRVPFFRQVSLGSI